ncbi:hypothetical protein N7454_001648 [Penicillium verhagenii]|nr:hypothetical protein N7454_001648 [Penicillium verhagenii]
MAGKCEGATGLEMDEEEEEEDRGSEDFGRILEVNIKEQYLLTPFSFEVYFHLQGLQGIAHTELLPSTGASLEPAKYRFVVAKLYMDEIYSLKQNR